MEQENSKLDSVINRVFSKDVQQKRAKKGTPLLKYKQNCHLMLKVNS